MMMRSVEDNVCYNHGPISQEVSNNSTINFEFHKGNGVSRSSQQRAALGKPTPSKWDDAQKWLVGLSRVGDHKNQANTKPRNSSADDLRLIAPVPQKEDEYSSSDREEDENQQSGCSNFAGSTQCEVETKKVDCNNESVWKINKASGNSVSVVRSICVRDMGTEMTPIASQEPSRTATPIRATTPAMRSPISSGSTTPVRSKNEEGHHTVQASVEGRGHGASSASLDSETNAVIKAKKLSSLESRAIAWDEAERAKYMARFKREEVKIQAWENQEKRKAEMEMRKMEVKAERMKARAQEKFTSKLASTRRIAEEKRTNAEGKLNEKALKTSEKADYIRRTGHVPYSLSFKLPSLCW